MSLYHLFIPYIDKDENDNLSYFADDVELLHDIRDRLIFVLATTPELAEEYKLLGSIARRCLFNFESHSNNVIHDMTMFAKMPSTEQEKYDFVRHIADLITYQTTACRAEDVVLCRGIAKYWDIDTKVIDEEIELKMLLIDKIIDSYKEKKERLLTSYKDANTSADKPNFVRYYILREELEKQQYIYDTPF